MKIPRTARLVLHILQEGKLRHSGFDFGERRASELASLEVDCHGLMEKSALTKRVQHPILRTLLSEAAHLKNALTTRGNHLTLEGSLSYIRIPRAGSTNICRAILREKFPALKDKALSSGQVNALTDNCIQRQLSDSERQNSFFTVVRNPFLRIVSVYREFFENRQGPFIYEDYLFGVFRQEMSFGEFVRTLALIPDALKDQHVKPQHRFLEYYHRRGVRVTVMKLESGIDIKSYLSPFGMKLEEPSPGGIVYDYMKYYDRQILREVWGIYRNDVDRLGYDGIYSELRSYF